MSTTTDPNDPNLGHGVDEHPIPQHKTYLVLSKEERAKGFTRPYRSTYRHVGIKPTHPLTDLTPTQKETYKDVGYVKYEKYPEGSPERSYALGRYWTQKQLDNEACGSITRMNRDIAETYARKPQFYGSTYCIDCSKHLPVEEFIWTDDGERVGS